MQPPVTLEGFLELVHKSGVTDAGALQAYVRTLRASPTKPEAPKDLAVAMVKEGLLTRFQAAQLLQGKWRGFIINGKYKLLERLGSGGTASVYLCQHAIMRRRVAIKVLPGSSAKDPGALERFHREARAAAALDHPNIVRAYDIEQDGEAQLLVMEYVDGSSLYEIVKKHGPISVLRACHYIRQAALGLQHAHEAGLVHRDIKPGNLLLDRNGTVKILDMGLARFFNDQNDNLTKEHNSNNVLGTIDYLAPEQAVNSHDVDIRADIYSLGITFYFLLTGKGPFSEGSVAQKILWHQLRKPEPVRNLRPEIPEEIAEILETMLAKDPNDRYPEPIDVVDVLEPWTETPIPPPPEAEMPQLSRAAQRSGDESTTKLSLTSRTMERPSSLSGIRPRPAPAGPFGLKRHHLVYALAGGSGVVIGLIALFLWTLVGWMKDWFGPNTVPPSTAPAVTATGPTALTEIQRFEGHTMHVDRIAISPNGNWALTASHDRTVRLWDLQSARELRTMVGHEGEVHFVAISPDSQYGLSASDDATIRLWNLTTGLEIRKFVGHQGKVWSAVFSPDGHHIFSGGMDKIARLWNVHTGAEERRFEGHTEPINWVAYAPDRHRAITASWDKSAILWNTDTGKEIRRLNGHVLGVTSVAIASDGHRAITGSKDKTVRLWDLDTGQETAVLSGHTDEVWVVAFTPDGGAGLSGGADQKIIFWNFDFKMARYTYTGHSGGVTGLAVLPDGKRFLSCSADKSVRLWPLP